jgi:hypothetical protein
MAPGTKRLGAGEQDQAKPRQDLDIPQAAG